MVKKDTSQMRIAVIGAGLAGLACARSLIAAGLGVTVFDKSRGFGGRLATRRAGDLAFDHGAQYLTARSDAFRNFLAANDKTMAAWTPRTDDPMPSDGEWLVGIPGMSALAKALAGSAVISKSNRIVELRRSGADWHLRNEADEDFGPFDYLVIAIPAPQASGLLATAGIEPAGLDDVVMAPCWTLMLAFDEPTGLAFDAMRPASGPIGWIARNSSKPGRDDAVEQWVAQAGPAWSRKHLEETPEAIAGQLTEAFRNLAPSPLPPPTYASAHRWRYALVERPLGRPCLFDSGTRLGLAGDWCIAPRAEAAFESGRALAQEIVTSLA